MNKKTERKIDYTFIGDGNRKVDKKFNLLRDLSISKYLPDKVTDLVMVEINNMIQIDQVEYYKTIPINDTLYNLIVPENFKMWTPKIIAVDFIAPTGFKKFKEKLSLNILNENRTYRTFNDNILEDVQESRKHTHSNWKFVERVVSTDSNFFKGGSVVKKLPYPIDMIEIHTMQVGSGSTLSSVMFTLSDDFNNKFNDLLHSVPEPTLIKENGKLNPLNRRQVLTSELIEYKEEVYDVIRNWMTANSPGYFSEVGFEQPIFEFSFYKSNPNMDEEQIEDILSAIGLTDYRHPYSSKNYNEIKLSRYQNHKTSRRFNRSFTTVIYGDADKVYDQLNSKSNLSLFNSGTNNKAKIISNYLRHNLQDFIYSLSVTKYLFLFEILYNRNRDNAIMDYENFNLKSTKRLRDSLMKISFNFATLREDLNYYHEIPKINQEVFDFQFEIIDKKYNLFDEIISVQKDLINNIKSQDEIYRNILSTVSSLGASEDSYKQSRLALIVALISLLVSAIPNLENIIHFLKVIFEYLFGIL